MVARPEVGSILPACEFRVELVPGEGALQALRGSSVGLGTDIGRTVSLTPPRWWLTGYRGKVALSAYRQLSVEYFPSSQRILGFRTGTWPMW